MSSINYSTVNGINSVNDLTCVSTPELLYKLIYFESVNDKYCQTVAEQIRIVLKRCQTLSNIVRQLQNIYYYLLCYNYIIL